MHPSLKNSTAPSTIALHKPATSRGSPRTGKCKSNGSKEHVVRPKKYATQQTVDLQAAEYYSPQAEFSSTLNTCKTSSKRKVKKHSNEGRNGLLAVGHKTE